MHSWMIAMAAGIVLAAWFPSLPQWYVCLMAPLPWLLLRRYRRHSVYLLSLALLAGLLWGVAYGYDIRRGLLPGALEQHSLLLRGRIAGLVQEGSSFGRPVLRFELAVEHCQRRPAGHCGAALRRVQLGLYDSALRPQPGERWQLRVKLRRPRGFANPGGFDHGGWLVAQRIGATGSVENSPDNHRLDAAAPWSVDTWRGRAHTHLRARLAQAQHPELILALLLGDGAGIDRAQWATLRATGTVHLFVVSGLHIALTGGLVLWLGRSAWRSPWARSRRRYYALGLLPALAAALAYALLAGFNLPIQRALVMFAVGGWALASWRELRAADTLALAFWLVLVGDPLAARNAGFWFSFVAVAALLLAVCGRRAGRAPRARWWRAQWAVFAASLPVLLLLSGQFTLLGLPANLLAIPWTTLVSMPLAFAALLADLGAPALGAWLWRLADWSLQGLWWYLEWLQQRGGAWVWQPLRLDAWMPVFAAAAALLMLLPRGVPGRWLAPLLLLPLLWPRADAPPLGSVRITAIDVGQGLAVLVETATHALLYDTGPVFGTGTTAAELAILPLLQRRGVGALDMLMVSHGDSDHAGGWRALRERVPVRRLLVGDALGADDEEGCRAGLRWQWDGIHFSVLHPLPGGRRGNDNSCVLRIAAGASVALLSGDISRRVEQRLLAEEDVGPTALLFAPHHGSASSSSAAFIARLQPHHVVFSAGHRNRFGHPHPKVLARYRDAGAQLLDTAASGAITFTLRDGSVAAITEQRRASRHYWDEAVCTARCE